MVFDKYKKFDFQNAMRNFELSFNPFKIKYQNMDALKFPFIKFSLIRLNSKAIELSRINFSVYAIFLLCLAQEYGFSQPKVAHLKDSVNKYRSVQPEKAMDFARTSISLATTDTEMANSLFQLGSLNNDQSKFDSAQFYFEKSLYLFRSLGDSINVSSVFQGLGEVKENLGLYPESLDYYKKSYAIRKINGTPSDVARSLNNIGNIYTFLTNYPIALENYLESLRISELEKNKKETANSFNNIGMVYDYTGDFDKALDYYTRAKKAYEELQDKRGLAGTLNNIGLIFKNKKQPEKSIAVYQEALFLFSELKSAYGVAALQNNIGVAYGLLNNLELALQFHKQALATNEKIGNTDGVANSNNSLGDTYLKQKQFAMADSYFRRGLQLAIQINAKDRMAESYEGLAKAQEGMTNYKDALSYSQSARMLRDSLYTAEKSKNLYEMEQKYESTLKEKQIALLNSETKNQKLLLKQRDTQLILTVIFLILFGIAVYLFFSRMRLRQKTTIEISRIEKERAIVKSIYEQRMSISKDMHDEIGSGLTHISLLSGALHSKAKEPKMSDELQMIASTSRGLVQSMNEIVWALNPQNETLESLSSYLREQTYQYFEPFNIQYSVNLPDPLPPVRLNNIQRRNLFLVTKEALNNALKYSRASNVSLTMKIEANKLRFEIIDDGTGFELNTVKKTSNGLANMNARMNELSGTFEISSSSIGTKVCYSMELTETTS
jgi:signal transduction histidine kinase